MAHLGLFRLFHFRIEKIAKTFIQVPAKSIVKIFLKSVGQMLPRTESTYVMCGSFSIVLVHEVPL